MKLRKKRVREALSRSPEGRFVVLTNSRTEEKAAELGTTLAALRMALVHRSLGTTPTDPEQARVLALLPPRA